VGTAVRIEVFRVAFSSKYHFSTYECGAGSSSATLLPRFIKICYLLEKILCGTLQHMATVAPQKFIFSLRGESNKNNTYAGLGKIWKEEPVI
jgi:hypothetical protein